MSIKPKILVTSAAGHTGAPAVHQLLEKGFPVRAFVRRRDARSDALEARGAEIFVGDLFDYRDLRKAMVGVQRAYYCPPFDPNLQSGLEAIPANPLCRSEYRAGPACRSRKIRSVQRSPTRSNPRAIGQSSL